MSEDGPLWGFMVWVKVPAISKSGFHMRKLKFLPSGNLPSVLHTSRVTAGQGPQSPDSQCGDLAHLSPLCNKYFTEHLPYCVPGPVLASGIAVGNVELLFQG